MCLHLAGPAKANSLQAALPDMTETGMIPGAGVMRGTSSLWLRQEAQNGFLAQV